jgi:hypothetical protein
MSVGLSKFTGAASLVVLIDDSSSTMVFACAAQWSQMCPEMPAINMPTWFRGLPQNEQDVSFFAITVI